jgi:phosphate starvation-inducible protein PhoH and related proteins
VEMTRDMVGKLRRNHQHRYELPLVSAPVEMEIQPVPMDPYALGLLLGDGCLTTSTTPSFATADPELVAALEDALDGVELVHRGGPDYVLRNSGGRRGGVIVTNPVTAILRRLGLAGTRSETKFVPPDYLLNGADVRLGMLQGLLDSDGGPVTQVGRTCRIQYTTCSPRLRNDVAYLVRSLGGVVTSRRRVAEGRAPGRAKDRDVPHRHDSFVLDIRLPAGVEPFRLSRKKARYDETGGGRPMRFIESIEPVGTMETVCIQVAAADSLYVTDDFLVTHNTLNDSFIILDEAQNTTPEQMKMIMTRLGFNSKMVVTGDVTQIDLPKDQNSGLITVSEILEGIEGIEFIRFGGEDVVRHRLVQRIVEAYDEHAARQAPGLRPAERRRA